MDRYYWKNSWYELVVAKSKGLAGSAKMEWEFDREIVAEKYVDVIEKKA